MYIIKYKIQTKPKMSEYIIIFINEHDEFINIKILFL